MTVLSRGGDPSEPPARLSRGGDPPEPPARLSRGGDPPEPARPPAVGDGPQDPATPLTTVLILNGPNLGRLGSREPEIYGSATLADIGAACSAVGASLGLIVDVRQTDDEAELIGWIHEAADRRLPVVLNPAAFTHYSYALRDALAMRTAPLVEVHLSNPAAREAFRHTSVVSAVADGTIAGFGPRSYELALRAVAGLLDG